MTRRRPARIASSPADPPVSPTDRPSPATTLEQANGQVAVLLDTLESVTELLEKVLGENEQLREQLAQRVSDRPNGATAGSA